MPELDSPSNGLLADILTVLEKIDKKLALQDEHIQRLTSIVDADVATSQNTTRFDTQADSSYTKADILPSLGYPIVKSALKKNQKISYRDWNLDLLEGHLDDELSKFLQSYLGDWYKIPADSRLPLSFSRYSNELVAENWDSMVVEFFHHIRPQYSLPRLNAAREFDNALRACPGNDFLIVDLDHQNHHILYRLGEEAIGNELFIPDTAHTSSAPWSRLMYAVMYTFFEFL